jgi:hypothetical protein
MPESKREVIYEFNEILALLEKDWGTPLELVSVAIKESGHPDTGDYRRAVQSITLKEKQI